MDNKTSHFPAEPEDIKYILNNLWERQEEELKMLGLNKEEALQLFSHFAEYGLKSGTLLVKDIPVFCTGVMDIDNEGCTWFMATKDFLQYGKEIGEILIEQRDSFEKEYVIPLCIYSVTNHPSITPWFNMLGFYIDETYQGKTKAGFQLFKFKRG